ncbi:zinc finger and BTB domain-containing protein 9 [Protopterus annectens]|uniref:zinc finger and BTB domain-containing protein 9 n=1 Tax=Protopterus annectens TaxID=7888 RepID=UPI001CFB2D68|nr:zinc finger and BTB domain-containing protein 9 [Protopterus annectens]
MEIENSMIQIDFPNYSVALLDNFNKHRMAGKFCDISIHTQGQVFQAHKSVLAASSPYFHDKLLLNDTNCIVLPPVIDPQAFENILHLIYTGKLSLQREEIPSYLMVASGLQMWQVVDRCSEILKERDSSQSRPLSSRASENQSPSSSNYFAFKEDGEPGMNDNSGHRRMAIRTSIQCQDHDVIRVRVPNDDEDEPTEICSGSLDKNVRIIIEEDDDGNNMASCSYAIPSDDRVILTHQNMKAVYIKQERLEEEAATVEASRTRETNFKSLDSLHMKTDQRSLSISDIPAYCKPPEFQATNEVDYIIPNPQGAETRIGEDGRVLTSSAGFSHTVSRPVDLHGNEIVSHASHGQVVHAPVKIVAAPDGKKFGCLCGKRFAVKPKRDRHIMLTFSLRPFGCSVCTKKFKLKHHLTEHMKTHEGNLYVCEECGRKFRVQSCYLKHKELCRGPSWAATTWNYKGNRLGGTTDNLRDSICSKVDGSQEDKGTVWTTVTGSASGVGGRSGVTI